MRRWGLQQLVALVLSLLLWAFVRFNAPGVGSQTLVQLTLDVHIRIENEPPDWTAYDIEKDVVKVTLQGDATTVNGLRESLVKAWVDLAGMDSPNVWPEVKVLAPGGVTVLSRDPLQVNVKLSKVKKRVVPVRVIVSGSPANGLTAGEVRLEPSRVQISGPEALVDEVQEVVSRVVLEGQSQDYSLKLRDLAPVNSQGSEVTAKLQQIKIHPSTVSATVPILSDNRTVAVAVSLDQLHVTPARGWSYRLEVDPEFVTLRLGRNQKPPKFLLTKPQSIAVSTKVDSRDVDLVIPDGVEVVGSSTVTLKVIPERLDTDKDEPDPVLTPAASATPTIRVTPPAASPTPR